MSKPIRYHVRFKLGDVEYEVTPQFLFIDHVEQEIESLGSVGVHLEKGDYRFSELAHVIHSALVTSGYNLSYQYVGQTMMDEWDLLDMAIIAGKIVMASRNVDPDTIEQKIDEPGEDESQEEDEGKGEG